MKTKKFQTHNIALFALYILGSNIFLLPLENSNKQSVLACFCTLLLGVFLYFILSFLTKKLYLEKDIKLFKILYLLVSCVLAFYILGYTAFEFLNLIKKVVLQDLTPVISAILLGLISFYFFKKRQENILKFFLLSFIVSLIIILFFVLALSFNFDLKNIYINPSLNLKELFYKNSHYITKITLPVIILPLYNVFTFNSARIKIGFIGVLTGFFLLAITTALPILIFGINLSAEYSFPLSKAVSILSVGRLFTRVDGIFHLVCFLTSLCKITVSAFVLSKSLKGLNTLLK